MPLKQFTINFFNVRYLGDGPHEELSETFTRIKSMTPESKYADYGDYVDGLAEYTSAGENLRFGDLRRYQSHNLPKHGAINTTPKPLPIEDSLIFESAFILDRKLSKIALLRYGGAIFPGRLLDYINSFRNKDSRVTFDLILRNDSYERLKKLPLLREASFEFTSHGPNLEGATGATGDVLSLPNQYGAGKIRITVSVDDLSRDASMKTSLLTNWFGPLKKLLSGSDGYNVKSYSVRGKSDTDSAIETVDLIEEALKSHVRMEVDRSINLVACKAMLKDEYLKHRNYLEAYAEQADED